MKNNLKNLSDDEIYTLIERYYNGEAPSKLMEEYHILGRPSQLYLMFPPEKYSNYCCEYCGTVLVIDRPSRATYKARWYSPKMRDLYCPVCHHKPYDESCSCEHCREAEQNLKREQIECIKRRYSVECNPVDFKTLLFREKVFLGALCRGLLEENLYDIRPYENSGIVLTPTTEMDMGMYAELYKKKVIRVSPNSELDSFVIGHKDFPDVYYRDRVIYYLNLLLPPNKNDLINEILNPSYYCVENEEEALDLWKEIAVAECKEYLIYQLQKVNFDFNPGEKTDAVFRMILEDFSVSQVYNIIWREVSEASRRYLSGRITKQHAANSVIGGCQRYAERAKAEKWDLKSYSRPWDLPQSVLSEFYFNKVLGIADMGFKIPPTIV